MYTLRSLVHIYICTEITMGTCDVVVNKFAGSAVKPTQWQLDSHQLCISRMRSL